MPFFGGKELRLFHQSGPWIYLIRFLALASRMSSARNLGWAMLISSLVRSWRFLPQRFATPYSVTIWRTSPRVVTTPAPFLRKGTIRVISPSLAVEGRAMIGFPPFGGGAPRGGSGEDTPR